MCNFVIILREEHRLRAFDIRVLKTVYEPKMDKVCRRLKKVA
jgi:hypothetical protein